MSSPHLFGVRHHGPGSARSLVRALEALSPDCILLEGPPEAEPALALAAHKEMKPPVALLLYDVELPQHSVFYPFAVFSPEWQALQYGLRHKIPVRFMDLPQSIQLALAVQDLTIKVSEDTAPETEESDSADASDHPSELRITDYELQDPLLHLARAAGYPDSERWWEHLVEHRSDDGEPFAAILEAMTALRDEAISSSLQQRDPDRERQREAHMRQVIRAAQKENFERIAVVCGAWHAPALAQMPAARDDVELLKGLPKRKVAATWIPWTYSRLALFSGYGAGIESPGWYDYLWSAGSRKNGSIATGWLTKVARLLRGEDLDASSASIIEAVRLAEALAALRGHALPGLTELNEASRTVLCFGDDLALQLIREKLVVSERLGEVPEATPMVPLAQDLAREQKRLRLPPEALQRQLDLDLRKPNDLDRSRLLHRLNLLGVAWGELEAGRGAQKGTFHELWTVQWQPEFAVALIEAGLWGTTIPAAAGAKVCHDADAEAELPRLTTLLDSTLLADLPEAAAHLMERVQTVAAVASDVRHLMGALPPLANILRYGNVRQTDSAMVAGVVDGLVARICIGLPGACASLNDEAAEEMFGQILGCHSAVGLLQNPAHSTAWHGVLRQLADAPSLHGLIAGRACRLLMEAREINTEETARRQSLALSAANPPLQAAAWVDGFLRNSGLLLLHDAALWNVLDDWVTALAPDHFTAVLPLLRRTFATFAGPERRQMGERVARGMTRAAAPALSSEEFDEDRASQSLPLLASLLGLKLEEKP